ncbi:MAG: hypothetical protein E6K81_13755 [Candidatus Eisenbacteria bacterium]|uniref:Uncharacterized protein n=1 Tax=Eiseniibacteriota bacterium TaxID=2212470 RepID=A0A538U229_UNCEI|nr:MAG: hypothetical protein E6K81_13755 [Candidatus Eisenbacteria bacterium]
MKGHSTQATSVSSRLTETRWNSIEDPGCYLMVASGDLVRIPAESLLPGHSPLLTFTSKADVRVAKLSDNPAEPISVLRSIAADNDYFVNF